MGVTHEELNDILGENNSEHQQQQRSFEYNTQYNKPNEKKFKSFYTKKEEAYESYKKFCLNNNISPLEKRDFEHQLRYKLKTKYPEFKTLEGQRRSKNEPNGPRCWWGIRLKFD